MTFLDYAILVLYLLGMLAIGYFASKKIHNAHDFSIGSKQIGPFVLICSSIATASGAGTCMGQAGKAYTEGFSAFWLVIAWTIGMFVLALMAKRIYNTNAESVSGIFEKFHNKTTGRVAGVYTMIYCFGTLISQTIGMGLVIDLILGDAITYQMAVLIGGGITIIYTLFGGFYAVTYTDTVQMIILGISVVIIFPLVVINGTADATLTAMENVFTAGTFDIMNNVSIWSLLAVIFTYTFSACTGIPYIQRVLAARNAKEAQSSMAISSIGYFVVGIVVMIFSIYAKLFFPSLSNSDTIVVQTMVHHFPTVLAGFGIAGLVAALMSTIDSYLLVVGQIFTQDICGWAMPNMSEKTELIICKYSTVLFGVISIISALFIQSILVVYEFGTVIYSAAIFFPFVLSIYWKKTSPTGVICGMISGSIMALLLELFPGWQVDGVIVGNIVSLIFTVLMSLIKPKKEMALS